MAAKPPEGQEISFWVDVADVAGHLVGKPTKPLLPHSDAYRVVWPQACLAPRGGHADATPTPGVCQRGIPHQAVKVCGENGAAWVTRTPGPRITNALLYRLS